MRGRSPKGGRSASASFRILKSHPNLFASSKSLRKPPVGTSHFVDSFLISMDILLLLHPCHDQISLFKILTFDQKIFLKSNLVIYREFLLLIQRDVDKKNLEVIAEYPTPASPASLEAPDVHLVLLISHSLLFLTSHAN